MFDLAWSEIALIGVVALVVIGPKDLPEAIRGVARGVQKLRRMVAEFQGQADELVREAKLDEVRNQIHEVRSAVNDIRNFDLRGEVERNVDADGSIRSAFRDDPLKPDWAPPSPSVTAPPPEMMEGAAGRPAEPPAFIPPADAARVRAEPAPPLPAMNPVAQPTGPGPAATGVSVPQAEARDPSVRSEPAHGAATVDAALQGVPVPSRV
jgi:sec-independent protein translocase protein TatB